MSALTGFVVGLGTCNVLGAKLGMDFNLRPPCCALAAYRTAAITPGGTVSFGCRRGSNLLG